LCCRSAIHTTWTTRSIARSMDHTRYGIFVSVGVGVLVSVVGVEAASILPNRH
jgi:hypothetical protein